MKHLTGFKLFNCSLSTYKEVFSILWIIIKPQDNDKFLYGGSEYDIYGNNNPGTNEREVNTTPYIESKWYVV